MTNSQFLYLEEGKMPEITQLCRTEGFAEPEGLWNEPFECTQGLHLRGELPVPANWAEIGLLLMEAFREQLAKRWHELAQIEGLEREILLLKRRCDNLERTTPVLVPIESFAPEPYEVVKPFHVVVRLQEDQYIACFFDANIGASGDTQYEAVVNLKDIVVGTFEILMATDERKLGPGPLRQKGILGEFVRKKS